MIGSHCPETEAVRMLQEACIMMQLDHQNIVAVLGLVLSQQPVKKMIIASFIVYVYARQVDHIRMYMMIQGLA